MLRCFHPCVGSRYSQYDEKGLPTHAQANFALDLQQGVAPACACCRTAVSFRKARSKSLWLGSIRAAPTVLYKACSDAPRLKVKIYESQVRPRRFAESSCRYTRGHQAVTRPPICKFVSLMHRCSFLRFWKAPTVATLFLQTGQEVWQGHGRRHREPAASLQRAQGLQQPYCIFFCLAHTCTTLAWRFSTPHPSGETMKPPGLGWCGSAWEDACPDLGFRGPRSAKPIEADSSYAPKKVALLYIPALHER